MKLLTSATVLLMCAGLTAAVVSSREDDASPATWQQLPSGQQLPQPRPGLRQLIPHTVRIGSAVNVRALAEDPVYGRTLAGEFNAVTPENAMKWANLEPTHGIYEWADSDRLVAFAAANKQAIYGHTLVWHTDVPSWVSEQSSPDELRTLLRSHVTNVVSRYRGKLWAWDVVNEVLAEDGAMRDTLWLRKLGPGYIADAFRWAHLADPQAVLFINEYGAEGPTKKAEALLNLVKNLRSQGVPVHGVGFQSHLAYDRPLGDLADGLRKFARIGMQVAITELDVRLDLPASQEKLRRQALVYRDVLNACLSVPACDSLTTWGFTDGSSWIPSYHKGYGAACLFDEQMNPKPALLELVKTLRPRSAFR